MNGHQKVEFFPFIHLLRAIAPLLVLWAHLCGWWLGVNNTTSRLYEYWENLIVAPFHLYQGGGHLGVLIFFLISGFVVTHVSLSETAYQFTIKRFFRIVPILVVSLLILLLVVQISKAIGIGLPLGNNSNTVKDYIFTLLLINRPLGTPDVLSVTWTLLIEAVYYVITALLIKNTKVNPAKATWYFICIISAMVMLSVVDPIAKRFADHIVYILFILIGRVIYLGSKKLLSIQEAIILGATSLLSYIVLYDYLLPNRMFTSPVLLIYSDMWAIAIFALSMILVNKTSRLSSFLADISYSVYLLHIPIGSFVLNIAKFHLPFKWALLAAILAILFFSSLTYRFIELPCQRFARKIIVDKSFIKGWNV